MPARNGNGCLNGSAHAEETTFTREEILEHIEREAQRRRGISAKKLIKSFNRGKLDDPGEVADLLGLASLLREDDELFVKS